MKLFHWEYCEVLKAYADGDCIVMAETVAEARAKARAEFICAAYDDENYEVYLPIYYDGLDSNGNRWLSPETVERFDSMYEQFKKDLEAEPRVIDCSVVFLQGSS